MVPRDLRPSGGVLLGISAVRTSFFTVVRRLATDIIRVSLVVSVVRVGLILSNAVALLIMNLLISPIVPVGFETGEEGEFIIAQELEDNNAFPDGHCSDPIVSSTMCPRLHVIRIGFQ